MRLRLAHITVELVLYAAPKVERVHNNRVLCIYLPFRKNQQPYKYIKTIMTVFQNVVMELMAYRTFQNNCTVTKPSF